MRVELSAFLQDGPKPSEHSAPFCTASLQGPFSFTVLCTHLAPAHPCFARTTSVFALPCGPILPRPPAPGLLPHARWLHARNPKPITKARNP